MTCKLLIIIIQFYTKSFLFSSKDKDMKIWIRNIYFIVALLIFFLASAFFVLLASGYNYDFSKNKFEKTSVLYVKSYPKNASIFLNDKIYKKPTPTEVIHLKPDLYNIRVEKENYQNWEKQFLIKPEQTVFVEDISLFYNTPKVSILEDGKFQGISISPDKQNILFYDLENKELNIFDLTEKRIINIEKNVAEINYSLWSADNQKVLLEIDGKYFISFIYFNEAPLELSKYIGFTPQEIVWDKFDSNLLYLRTNNEVYSFYLDQKILKKINLQNVLSIQPEKDKLFYISAEDSIDALRVFNIEDQTSEKVLDLGNSSSYKFIWPYNDYFCLLDGNNTLYLIDPNAEEYLIKKFYNVKNVEWDLYNRTLLLKNDFEVWSYDLLSSDETLINRFSKKIESTFWHRNNNHIFYIIDNQVYVIELDNRDRKNIYPLDNIYNSQLFLANKKGNILYYITPSGLVESVIQ
jgi:PEGA domain